MPCNGLDAEGDNRGLIIKTDKNGDLLWSREYFTRDDRNNYIYDIQPTTDGGYVFCGSGVSENNKQSGWLAKLDCAGNDSITHYNPDAPCIVNSIITHYQNKNIQLYPNPALAGNTIQVSWTQGLNVTAIQITDASGRKVLNQSSKKLYPHFKTEGTFVGKWNREETYNYRLETTHYPKGIYWIKLKTKEGMYYAKKFVIQ